MNMENNDDVMRTLGRIEGKVDGLAKLPDRVAALEHWQAWLKGGWAAVATAVAYVFKTAYEK
jgi:hypothetical protein